MNVTFKNKKVIIFDLDGTIVNLTADWMSLKDTLIEKYKKYYKEESNFERVSTCLYEIVKRKDEKVLEDFFNIIREFELKNIKDTQPIDETIFFINNKELFGVIDGVKFAILSLNTRSSIIRALELAKIYDKIDYIVGREDVRRWKPSPEGLLKIKNHYNVNKKQMIFFGDLKIDMLTGQNAGIEAYFIDDLIKLVNKIQSKLKLN
ncbi:MAG: HAD family hydrolase [Candidatus Hodarchaeota archaeon]